MSTTENEAPSSEDALEVSETGDPELDRILKERYEAVMNGTAKGRPGPEVMVELKERFG